MLFLRNTPFAVLLLFHGGKQVKQTTFGANISQRRKKNWLKEGEELKQVKIKSQL